MSNDELIAALCGRIVELNNDYAEAVLQYSKLETKYDELRRAYDQQQEAWRARELHLVTENRELRAQLKIREAV